MLVPPASPGGRPRLVVDHTHKEPCTKIERAGACSFCPSQSRGVRFYLFISLSLSLGASPRAPMGIHLFFLPSDRHTVVFLVFLLSVSTLKCNPLRHKCARTVIISVISVLS